jgi:prophage regulatory protein
MSKSAEPFLRDMRRLATVCRQTGLSAATIYRKVRDGSFPRQAKLGVRASAWPGDEIDAWIASRIAARDID